MADTFSSSLRLQLQAIGGNSNTWGVIANTQYQLIEQAITGDNGYAGGSGSGINIAGLTTYTLTVNQGAADQARQALYPFTGALLAACTVTVPGVVKIGWALNATTGGFAVTLQVSGGGTALTLPSGSGWTLFYCDGVNIMSPSIRVPGIMSIGGNASVDGNMSVGGNLTVGGTTPGATPVGTVVAFAGATPPSQWYLCYGQAVSRTTYAALFSAIGTAWGAGDGSTTFNLPDLRGRALFGQDNMGGTAASRLTSAVSGIAGTTLGAIGGDQNFPTHTHSVTDPTHTHSITDPGHTHIVYAALRDYSGDGYGGGGWGQNYNITTTSSVTGISVNTATTGITIQNSGTGVGGNVPPAAVVNFIIFAGV